MVIPNFLRNKYAVLLVWFFGGLFGLHRFLIGFYRTALLMALWSLFAFIIAREADLGFMRIAIIIWWLADLVLLIWIFFFNKDEKIRNSIIEKANESFTLFNQNQPNQAYQVSHQAFVELEELSIDTEPMANDIIYYLGNHIQLARLNNKNEEALSATDYVEEILSSEYEIQKDNASTAMFNSSLVYLDHQMFDKAKINFQKLLNDSEGYHVSSSLKEELYYGLSRADEGLDNYEGAILNAQKALEFTVINHPNNYKKFVEIYIHIADLYNKNSQLEHAQQTLQKALDIAKKNNDNSLIRQIEQYASQTLIFTNTKTPISQNLPKARDLYILLKYELATRLLSNADSIIQLAKDNKISDYLNNLINEINQDNPHKTPLTSLQAKYQLIHQQDWLIVKMPKPIASNEAIFMILIKIPRNNEFTVFLLEKSHQENINAIICLNGSQRINCGFLESNEIKDFIMKVSEIIN